MRERFGDRLFYLRKESNLTQEELADALKQRYEDLEKLNKSLISRYEDNIHEPRFSFIEQVAEFFGVTTDFVMGRTNLANKYMNKKVSDNVKQIPILGTIAAGKPILAQEYFEGVEYTDTDSDFCLKVKGDSMINARIYNNDIVFIKKQSDVEHGEIAAVLIDGEEATLKRVFKYGNKIVLHPENPTMQDMTFTKNDKMLVILGKVIEAKFKVR